MARLALALVLAPATALADRPAGVCVDVEVGFTPSEAMQIVAWLETAAGNYVDTMYITHKTGRFGLGNRPGRSDFNTGSPTGDTFPYGRRIQTFPVWAHRHAVPFPLVVFQNGDENNLSHPFDKSSVEVAPPYCRPIQPLEMGFDTGTCASATFTDKGTFSPTETSKYPPRSDLTRRAQDAPTVDMYRSVNVFDAVSRATPPGGTPATVSWAAPQHVDFGDYVVFVETAKTYDFNPTYNPSTFPSPAGIPWAEYGLPWRGQPSIVYRVPLALGEQASAATTDTYAGYGDPLGATGTLHSPDATITTDTPGSGASRMQMVSDGGELFRVRVRATPELDPVAPDGVRELSVHGVRSATANLLFMAPGDDVLAGRVKGYDIRVRAGSPVTEGNFESSAPVTAFFDAVSSGQMQTVEMAGLLPETEYYVGIRPYDNCFNRGPLSTASFTTAYREGPEVDWCFVATAAYGSPLATDVGMLRRFRDSVLSRSVLGELAIQTYYTFGPAVAVVVGSSELLRATARAVLAPIVHTVRQLAFQ